MSINEQWSGKSARNASNGRFAAPRTGADHLGPPIIPAPGEIGPGYAGRGRWAGDPGTVAGVVPAGDPRPDLQHLGSATPPAGHPDFVALDARGRGRGSHAAPDYGLTSGVRSCPAAGTGGHLDHLDTGAGIGADVVLSEVTHSTGTPNPFNRGPLTEGHQRPPARGPEHDAHQPPDVYSGWLARAVAHHRGRR